MPTYTAARVKARSSLRFRVELARLLLQKLGDVVVSSGRSSSGAW